MDTAAKTVYAAVGSAGPGVIVGAGATDRTCHAKNDLWLSIGPLHVLSVGSCLTQYVSGRMLDELLTTVGWSQVWLMTNM